jgi:hypothetical protein
MDISSRCLIGWANYLLDALLEGLLDPLGGELERQGQLSHLAHYTAQLHEYDFPFWTSAIKC